MRLFCRSNPRFRFILVGLLSFATSAVVSGQVSSLQLAVAPTPWDGPVRSLADKIVSALGSVPSISLDLKNMAGLDPADFSALNEQFRSELARRGVEIKTGSSAEAQIEITLSEGNEGYVWVAEIKGKSAEQVAIVNGPPSEAIDSPEKPVPFLQATELFRQPRPLLDFAQAVGDDGVPLLLLLEPDRLVRFQKVGSSWTMRDSVPFPSFHSTSRDLRGRIDFSGPHGLEAFLAGISCTGSWHPTLTLDCRQDDPSKIIPLGREARLSISSDRMPASFSVASHSANGRVRWIETKPDGTAQLFENPHQSAVATFAGWGDDIVSITSKCTAVWSVLVTGTGDWTRPDSIQMYEITDRQAVAVGRPFELPGPVLAMWQSNDGEFARVIWRDLQTGMYEASIVSLSCGN
jgi:hypothetical protein